MMADELFQPESPPSARPDSPPPAPFALLGLDRQSGMRRSPSGRRLSRAPLGEGHLLPPRVTFGALEWYERLHRMVGEALSDHGSVHHHEDDEPPTPFLGLDILIDVGASLWQGWLAATKEVAAAAADAAKDPSMRIDHAAHRYPCCLVWTPIHPLTWVAPYVGHVGLGDRDGIIHDFAGRHVGRDAMAFGWPARYLQLDPARASRRAGAPLDWAAEVSHAADAFEKVEYGLLTWNCHSFLAGFLNAIEHTPEGQPGSFGLLRTWTVAGVGLRLFLHAHYVHGRRAGWMQQWGGTAVVTWCVLWLGVWHGVWDLAKLWLLLLVSVNGFFVAWFGALAFLRLDSQRGFVHEDADRRDSDSDDDMLRTGL